VSVLATSQSAIAAISLVFIVAGFAACGGLWWVMVVRGGREERRAEAAPPVDDPGA